MPGRNGRRKRCAIYARVSTRDQEPKTQLRELDHFAKARGFVVTHRLIEYETGAKLDRPQLKLLMELARRREIEVVLVWRFDRFARSVQQLLDALTNFRSWGVDFISLHDPVDTTSAAGELVFTIFAAIAAFERQLIGERVRAGLARAREEGKQLGRPALPAEKVTEIRQLLRRGLSNRKAATALGVSEAVVRKYNRSRARRPSSKSA